MQAGYDGSSLDVVAEFLRARSGYCVHFASTMAVGARMLGIPARIQVGFTPGEFREMNELGQPVMQVTTDNLHAWAELWIDGYGWVPFEATPSGGVGSVAVPDLNSATDEPSAAPTSTPTPTTATDAAEPGEDVPSP